MTAAKLDPETARRLALTEPLGGEISRADLEARLADGHTHTPSEYSPRKNLRSLTARSEYGLPALSLRMLEVA